MENSEDETALRTYRAKIESGKLYIVGTPIGNLKDITLRAIEILKIVDLIAAEDTRHTGILLQHLQINTPQISYHEHNKYSRLDNLLAYLNEGKTIALVTDAGMPGISDPGYDLILACLDRGISVIPIPGVTAVITALVGSGLPTDRFIFEGFLPTKNKERDDRLQSLQNETRTIIFYESPHRLLATLVNLSNILGSDRRIVLARELTKLHEEFWRGTIAEAIELYTNSKREPKGEFTIVVRGTENDELLLMSSEELKAEIEKLLAQGLSRSQASRQLAKVTSFSRQKIYQFSLEIGK